MCVFGFGVCWIESQLLSSLLFIFSSAQPQLVRAEGKSLAQLTNRLPFIYLIMITSHINHKEASSFVSFVVIILLGHHSTDLMNKSAKKKKEKKRKILEWRLEWLEWRKNSFRHSNPLETGLRAAVWETNHFIQNPSAHFFFTWLNEGWMRVNEKFHCSLMSKISQRWDVLLLFFSLKLESESDLLPVVIQP